MDEKEVLIPKSFNIWETLCPFKYSKYRGKLPRLYMHLTSKMSENEFIIKNKMASFDSHFLGHWRSKIDKKKNLKRRNLNKLLKEEKLVII